LSPPFFAACPTFNRPLLSQTAARKTGGAATARATAAAEEMEQHVTRNEQDTSGVAREGKREGNVRDNVRDENLHKLIEAKDIFLVKLHGNSARLIGCTIPSTGSRKFVVHLKAGVLERRFHH